MESKFIPTLQAGNGYTYLKLKGILDEDNLLANLLSQIQGRLLLIDMAEMERINSCGVRDWVNWLNQIQALGITVILLRCSPAVVAQANMVTNFAADAFIHSFYAPYVDPNTNDEQSVLLFTEEIRKTQPIRAPKILNASGEELEFDEFEESYFSFVSDPRIMGYQVPADIQSVIEYFMPEAATRQPILGVRPQAGPSAVVNSSPSGAPGGIRSGIGMAPAAVPATPTAPKASGQPVRHEQPPIPSSSGYIQAPSAVPQAAPRPVAAAPKPVAPAAPVAPKPAAPAAPAASAGLVPAPAPAPASVAPTADSPAMRGNSNTKLIIIIGGIVIVLLVVLIVVLILNK